MIEVYVIKDGERVVVFEGTEEQCENFCESWGWMYSDSQLLGTYKSYCLMFD